MSQARPQNSAVVALPRPGMVALVSAWGPVLLWMVVIFWLSGDRFSDERTAVWLSRFPILSALGLPPHVIEVGNLIVRKSAHFVEYAVLSMLAYRAIGRSVAAARRRKLAAAILLAVLCATVDELHQATTLTRSASLKDVLLDSIGALAGALSGASLLYWRARSNRLE